VSAAPRDRALPATPGPGLPLSDPAMLATALVAALGIAVLVSFPLGDTDFWQHLAVGRAIWTTHQIPATNVWTWPTWGERQVLPSWGFRALLWPFWALGGVAGLSIWRWATTLAAFALAWAAARRMGARGVAALPVIVLCALVYRLRASVRPETLVAVLLALEILLLEARRQAATAAPRRGRARLLDPRAGLVLVAWLWANVHISYYVGLVLLAIHVVAGRAATRPGAPRPAPLGLTLLAAIAVSFANPFGARALAQPFEYFFVWRHEPLFRTIGELGPIDWSVHAKTGLPLLVLGWPLLAIARARRRGVDAAELLTLAFFFALAQASQRFTGMLAIAAAPYLARDLDDAVAAVRSARPALRAALAAGACVALTAAGWLEPIFRPGPPLAPDAYPRAACDFIAARDVRGRAFNSFEYGGYLLWRFWPERDRLPFMDIHQTGTPADRLDYLKAQRGPEAWREFAARRRIDWVLLRAVHAVDDRTMETLDADSLWALVFTDDAAALYTRREGPLAAVADSFGYHVLPASDARRLAAAEASLADTTRRARLESELARAARESPRCADALNLLSALLATDGRWADAGDALERAHALRPGLAGYVGRRREIDAALAAGAR
jgi:hypothetical protein